MGRKRKDAEVPAPDKAEVFPAARHVAPLRKPADVTRERKRLYRATINGRISADEAARLSYMLTSNSLRSRGGPAAANRSDDPRS